MTQEKLNIFEIPLNEDREQRQKYVVGEGGESICLPLLSTTISKKPSSSSEVHLIPDPRLAEGPQKIHKQTITDRVYLLEYIQNIFSM